MTGTSDIHGLSRASEPRPSSIPVPPRRFKTRVLVPVVLLLGLVALALYGTWDAIVPSTSVRTMPVLVKSVQGETPGSVVVQAPGWLEPDPHPIVVPALVDGVVEELLVLEGDVVEPNQVVARLIDEDLEFARDQLAAQLDEREAGIRSASADLAAAQQDLETLIIPTRRVAEARAAVAGAEAEIARLRARIQVAEAKVRSAEDEYERKSGLIEIEAVSRGEVERLRLLVDANRAELEATRAEQPVLEARRDSADAQLAAAERSKELRIDEQRAVAAAEAQLQARKAARRNTAAELGDAELHLERAEVRAPVGGVVMQRVVAPGTTLRSAGPGANIVVVELYDPEHLQVRVDVPLADAAQVGVGQKAEIVVDALPDRVFEGVVSRLVHVADIAKNTVEVKVAVHDPVDVMKPQMLARVRFLANEQANRGESAEVRQRVLAPAGAVRADGGGSAVVWVAVDVVEGRGRAERRSVTLGSIEIEDHVEAREGLRPGDRVILDPPEGLQHGDRITLVGGAN
ncbi:MAG: efflux RND transporter periplasmic adaptor subunit [Planctomycetota bacterium]